MSSIYRLSKIKIEEWKMANPISWRRRINVLIDLNKDWENEWGGKLQFGTNKWKRA
jgi:hypothetical protein